MVDHSTVAALLRVVVPALYGAVAVGYGIEFIKNRTVHLPWTLPLFFAGIALHGLLFVVLFVQEGHLPFDTIFRGMLFMALVIALFYAGIERFLGQIRYGAFIMPVNAGFTALASVWLNNGVPLPRSLHSAYFFVHTSLLFLAYACFILSFVISLMYLLQYREITRHRIGPLFKRLPSLDEMDQSIMRLDALGLGLLVFGLVTGFLWLEMAVGTPIRLTVKIALAGSTAMLYLSEHLLRIGKGWNGQRAAIISIIGFAAVLLTALAGRHGY
jgi:ABC-type transport system involved in cytochrome c biogenesis permease subunit